MTMFSHGNIGGFMGNNQTIIKYKNFICLSNLQFNYMSDCGSCLSTQHLCFGVTGHCTLCNTHECFCDKSCIDLEWWMPESDAIRHNGF